MPHSVKNLLEINEDPIHILLMLWVLFVEDSQVEYLLRDAPPCSETNLPFCNDIFRLWLNVVKMFFNMAFLKWLKRLMVL